jgi:hypothetical protein
VHTPKRLSSQSAIIEVTRADIHRLYEERVDPSLRQDVEQLKAVPHLSHIRAVPQSYERALVIGHFEAAATDRQLSGAGRGSLRSQCMNRTR